MTKYFALLFIAVITITGCASPVSQGTTPSKDIGEAETLESQALFEPTWTCFQFGPWLFSPQTPTYGLNTGIASGIGHSAGIFMPLMSYLYDDNHGCLLSFISGSHDSACLNGLSFSAFHFENFIDKRASIRNNGVMFDFLNLGRNINGLACTAITLGGKKNGLDISAITLYGSDVNGLQLALIASLPEFDLSSVNGVQIALSGAKNVDGVALGLYNPNGLHKETAQGLPAAVAIGLVNYGSQNGLQIGLFNRVQFGNPLQFGLINYNPESVFPWCPLLNYNF